MMVHRFAVTIGGRIASAALQMLILALLARSLGVSAFGELTIVSALVLLSLGILELGTGTVALTISSIPDGNRVLSTIVLVRLAAGAIAISAILLIFRAQDRNFAFAVAFYSVGESVGDLATAVLQGRHRSGWAVSALLSRRLITLAPFALGLGKSVAVLALVLAGAAGVLWLVATAIPQWARPSSLIQYVRSNRELIATTLGHNANQLDAIVVGTVGGTALAGSYGAAARLSNPVNLAVSSLLQVLVPELGRRSSDNDREQLFRRVRGPVIALAVVIASLSIISPWIIRILYGPAFAAAAPILAGVLVGAGISSVSQLYMAWFFATGVPPSIVVGTYAAIAVGLVSLWTLGGVFGTLGLGVAVVLWRLTSASFVLASWHLAKRDGYRR